MTVPIAPILPVQREVQWSDLLAVLIEMDPTSASALGATTGATVHREVSRGNVRADLVLDQPSPVVVEVKVLSDVRENQLEGLQEHFPECRPVLVHPRHLGMGVDAGTSWETRSWEDVLTPFTTSRDDWVARTASAWLAHLAGAVPPVDDQTRWDEITGTDFAIALRTRMTFVHRSLAPPEGVGKDIVTAGAGKKAVVRLWAEAVRPGYQVMIETEERLPVQSFPRQGADPETTRALGPAVRITLLQLDVPTSRDFDWDLLHAMWLHVADRSFDWIRTSPRMKADHDRAGLRRVVDKGAPTFIGQGFGEGWARQKGVCQFGPRFQLPADVRLADLIDVMDDMGVLVHDLARITP